MVVSIYGDDQKKRNFLIKQSYKSGVGSRVESGSDDPDYLVNLGTFLVGQVGLIRKLNYLNVTWIFNRSHVL